MQKQDTVISLFKRTEAFSRIRPAKCTKKSKTRVLALTTIPISERATKDLSSINK